MGDTWRSVLSNLGNDLRAPGSPLGQVGKRVLDSLVRRF